MNSRAKGKRGELEFSHWLTDQGFPARRGQQRAGGPDSPDVVCPDLPIHWEVKRVQAFQLYPSLEQAENDARGKTPDRSTDRGLGVGGACSNIPVVAHRRNRKAWVCVLYARDFLELLRKVKDSD